MGILSSSDKTGAFGQSHFSTTRIQHFGHVCNLQILLWLFVLHLAGEGCQIFMSALLLLLLLLHPLPDHDRHSYTLQWSQPMAEASSPDITRPASLQHHSQILSKHMAGAYRRCVSAQGPGRLGIGNWFQYFGGGARVRCHPSRVRWHQNSFLIVCI